ncbi:MAG: hypothetical protein ACP5OG_00545 [Candidatus Nanoarchaeia archaeon]
MKNLKPSHRENKRYLLIEGKDADKETIEKTILDFIGILGFASCSPKIIKQDKNMVVLAINTDSLDKIKASFLMSGKELNIKKISGVINKVIED